MNDVHAFMIAYCIMPTLHLSALYEHPLKSARGQAVETAEVCPEGLAFDRRFLVHTPDGTFVSGRSHPRLVLIEPRWDGLTLKLSAPGVSDLTLQPTLTRETSVAVWKDRFPAWDQGDTAAAWFSAFLKDTVRLAWLGESRRLLRWDRDRRVTFADAAPLLLLGTASLRNLSDRVGETLSMRRFRPNLVVDGVQPFEEDSWRRLRIGEVEFLNLDGCGRCEFTTIDPETAERHPRGEPVATLEAFRRVDTGIYFGMNLMPLSTGMLRCGDPVTVLEHRRPLIFGPMPSFPGTSVAGWPEGPAVLRCTAVRTEAPEVKTFRLVRQDGQKVGWNAGQYLSVKLTLPDGIVHRSYSLSSAPGTELEVTVKRFEDGRASGWIHEHWRVGSTIQAEALGGNFTLQDHPWPSYLFLGAGSGVTPLISMLRWIADQDLNVAVAFHQTYRTRAEVLFAAELETLRQRLGDRLKLTTRITAEEGRMDHQSLVKFCPDLRDRRAFVCGPSGFRAGVRELLMGAGFKVDRRYHEELFGEAPMVVPDDAVPGIMTFIKSKKKVLSDGRTTILQLAERAGIELPSSCRSGDCGTCRVSLSDGTWVLACRCYPSGDETFEL